jgi:hypothetical protein
MPRETKEIRPIGYVEVQRSWSGSHNPDMPLLMLNEVYAVMARDEPHMMPYGSRTEMTFDGAGREHYTIYVGFVPRPKPNTEATPALDPRNLNDAPAPQIGAVSAEMAVQPGYKEEKFGRGT